MSFGYDRYTCVRLLVRVSLFRLVFGEIGVRKAGGRRDKFSYEGEGTSCFSLKWDNDWLGA